MNDLITRIRAIADELSSRGIQAGHVETGTQRRAAELNRELVALFNTELEVTDTGQRLPTSKGVILRAMIQHLVAAAFGARSHSPMERENRILAAAKALPGLCDKLELKSDSAVLSPIESKNEGTTEGTKNSVSGDNADNSERKTKRKFCDRCEQLKRNWFNLIEREQRDIPLQTFLKEFFANSRKEDIWNPVKKGKPTPTNWEAMEKKFRANETEWNPEHLALIANLRGTIGGH